MYLHVTNQGLPSLIRLQELITLFGEGGAKDPLFPEKYKYM